MDFARRSLVRRSLVGVVLLAATVGTAEANFVQNGNFEEGASSWTLLADDGGGSVGLNTQAQSPFCIGVQGLRFDNSATNGYYPFAKGAFAPQADGKYVFAFDFLLESPEGQWAVELRTSNKDIGFLFIISGTDFRVRTTLTDDVRVAGGLVPGTWYHAEITLDSKANQCLGGSLTPWGGGAEKAWNLICATPASDTEFKEVVFRGNGRAFSGGLSVDNVSVAPFVSESPVGKTVPADPWSTALYGENWSPTPELSFETDKLIQDFSYAGYAQGERPIPAMEHAPIIDVTAYGADPSGSVDSTAAIQAALNEASQMPDGTVVYMPEGTFLLSLPEGAQSCLQITNSHVVLRGAGVNETRLLNTTTRMRTKKIISVCAPVSAAWKQPDSEEIRITQDLMSPTFTIPVESTAGFQVGEYVIVRCDPTDAWLADHNEQGWTDYKKEIGSFLYYRKIVAVNGDKNEIILDIPTRYTLKKSYDARVYRKTGMISEVGLENFSIGNREHPGTNGWGVLDFAAPTGEYTRRLIKDAGLSPEDAAIIKSANDVHFSFAIAMIGVRDSWVKNVESFQEESNQTGCHLLSNGLRLKECRNISLINCSMQKTQYGGGGGNGYMYRLDNCNECLLEKCTAGYARHGFDLSGMACSGNVFYQCFDKETGRQTGGPSPDDNKTTARSSDSHMFFSHSNLYDGCIAQNSWFEARDRYAPKLTHPKHNTTSAHTVFWNTTGLSNSYMPYVVWSVQGRYGYVIGTKGAVPNVKIEGNYPDRTHVSDPVDHIEGVGAGDYLRPVSLFEDQRQRRLGF